MTKKEMKPQPKILLAYVGLAVLLAGCASQQQQKPEPAPASKPPASGYGPHYTTFDANGVRYVRGSLGYPSGLRDGSGVLLEKTVPAEVPVGSPFSYQYRVVNQTPCDVRDVVITDSVSANFKENASDPKPAAVADGVATWKLAEIPAGQSATINVKGTASEEGMVKSCGWLTYTAPLCESIKVVKPALQIVKTLPPDVGLCDPIPATFSVRNSGSSVLTGVKVSDTLPAGLKTKDGQTSLAFDAGTLAPGASREFRAELMATQIGKYDNTANATCLQNVNASAKASVTVRAPVLALSCDAPAERFAGRPIEICLSVANTGNGAAANAMVDLVLPPGVEIQSATGGGMASAGRVLWRFPSIAAGSSNKVCVTVVMQQVGTVSATGMARAACAKDATSSCTTRVLGIPAVLLEVVDIEDPIEVGKNETYVVDVTNQGSAPATNVRLTFKLEEAQEFVSGAGPTAVTANGRTITTGAVGSIPPKGKATYRITVKALKAGDVRFSTSLLTDQINRPVDETESTNQY
jgi:uncharacterized repeat protein (TIGR01451 family)